MDGHETGKVMEKRREEMVLSSDISTFFFLIDMGTEKRRMHLEKAESEASGDSGEMRETAGSEVYFSYSKSLMYTVFLIIFSL